MCVCVCVCFGEGWILINRRFVTMDSMNVNTYNIQNNNIYHCVISYRYVFVLPVGILIYEHKITANGQLGTSY